MCWSGFTYAQLAALHIERWPLAVDFVQFYKEGTMALYADHATLFQDDSQLEWLAKVVAPVQVGEVIQSHGPPMRYVFMMPIALIPIQLAYKLWLWGTPVLGLIALYLMARKEGRATPLALWILMLSCFPAVHTTWLGQFSWVAVSALCLLYYGLRHQRDWLAGLALIVMAMKTQYLPLLLTAIPFSGRKQLWVASIVCIGVLLAVTAAVLGPESFGRFLIYVSHNEPQEKVMVSVRGLLRTWFDQRTTLICNVVLYGIMGLFCTWVWRQAWRNSNLMPWAMAIVLLSALLLSPHSFAYDCLLIAVPFALTLPALTFADVFSSRPTSYRMWCIIGFLYPIITWVAWLTEQFLHDPAFYARSMMALNTLLLCCAIKQFFNIKDEPTAENART